MRHVNFGLEVFFDGNITWCGIVQTCRGFTSLVVFWPNTSFGVTKTQLFNLHNLHKNVIKPKYTEKWKWGDKNLTSFDFVTLIIKVQVRNNWHFVCFVSTMIRTYNEPCYFYSFPFNTKLYTTQEPFMPPVVHSGNIWQQVWFIPVWFEWDRYIGVLVRWK